MNLSYYNDEIDNILWDILEDDFFMESDLQHIIDTVADTIYQYDKNLSIDKLKLVVQYIIENKYQKKYIYDNESEFNQVIKSNNLSSESSKKSKSGKKSPKNSKSSPKSTETNSDIMSINASDLNIEAEFCPTQYINPELETETPDNVRCTSARDLVSHRHDYDHDVFKEKKYIRRRKRIVELKKIPQHEQKSAGWLAQRNECLTATAVATVLDEDPYKYPAELLLDKCGRGDPFIDNENVHHGKKYEEIGSMFYSFRNNIKMAEYGLIQHEKYKYIGASPDGICEKTTLESDKLSKLVGRLLEIKFPKLRKINTQGNLDGDICPHYYYVQVQTQLFVTKMDECDFLQCKIEEYESWEDFIADSNPLIPGLSNKTNLEKGCLIQLLPKNMVGVGDPNMCLYNAQYIYPPKLHMTHQETVEWCGSQMLHFHKNDLSKYYLIDRVIYWRLSQVACHLIRSDTQWFKSKIPMLKQFWMYIEFYKKNEIKLNKLIKYIDSLGGEKGRKEGVKNTADIFAKVHKDYLTEHKNTNFLPLYQEENPWRKKYEKKKENYEKFLQFKNNKGQFSNSNKKKKIINM